jgi:antitoxin Phd
MQHTWQLQEAKNRFCELVDLSLSEGPQIVTRHGKPVVQIVPIDSDSRAKQAPKASRGPQTAFGKHMMSLLDMPPGPDLELPVRRSRKPVPIFEE